MADLLPSALEVERSRGEPRVVGVDSEDADEVLAALSSETARSLLAALHEEPATASELADAADTSLQNAQYHLEKLTAADLVEEAGTRYSAKGREMSVYAPADDPLVLFAGPDDSGEGLTSALTRVLGAVSVLGLASVVVQVAVEEFFSPEPTGGTGQMGIQSTEPAADAAAGLPPGLLFFLGGLLVLLVFVALLYLGE